MFRFAVFALAFCIFGLLSLDLPASGQELHVLKGRVIRSLSVEADNPDHILVGQKGQQAGSALVFQSLDGGRNWRTLNANRALAPAASDVQAVLAVSRDILLAGTWKHGLYVSRTGGSHRFSRLTDFPASDIRDLKMVGGVIYAATGRNGVYASNDLGKSWAPIGPGRDFLWSLTLADGKLYASSPETGVHLWRDGNWLEKISASKAYSVAVSQSLTVIAGESGVWVQRSGKWSNLLKTERFADVQIGPGGSIFAASWQNGIAVFNREGQLGRRLVTGASVIHLELTGGRLFAGTWGDGLYILDVPIALIAAVKRNDVGRVRQLLAGGINPDVFDANRNTGLIFAARDGFKDIARLLIDAGADINWADGEKVTPLILAAHKDQLEMVKLLLSQGADPAILDQWGRTALDYARRRGANDPIARLLAP